jgi:hypothetical protein
MSLAFYPSRVRSSDLLGRDCSKVDALIEATSDNLRHDGAADQER